MSLICVLVFVIPKYFFILSPYKAPPIWRVPCGNSYTYRINADAKGEMSSNIYASNMLSLTYRFGIIYLHIESKRFDACCVGLPFKLPDFDGLYNFAIYIHS